MQLNSETNPITPTEVSGKAVSAKLERALQLKDRCDHDLEVFYESKRGRHRPRSSADNHGELLLLEQEKPNENLIRDKRELERVLRKLSPTISSFASTHAEFVHLLQLCSTCSNRIAFCPTCTDKAAEFFSGYTSAELFSLYGADLPSANEDELSSFAASVAAREARAIREDCAEGCAQELK